MYFCSRPYLNNYLTICSLSSLFCLLEIFSGCIRNIFNSVSEIYWSGRFFKSEPSRPAIFTSFPAQLLIRWHARGLEYRYVCMCTHTHTHTSQAYIPCKSLKRANNEYSAEILQGCARQVLMLKKSNERGRNFPFVFVMSEEDDTKICPWSHVSWDQVTGEPNQMGCEFK